MATDELKPPKESKGDIAHSLAKAGLAAIPLVGGSAVEVFQMVLRAPIEHRRDKWMESVGERIKELEDKGLDIEELTSNDAFVSAAMHASALAMKTHDKEKLDALRNALMNIAQNQAPEEALQYMFFDWIDSFAPLHIQILRLFQSPKAPMGVSVGGLSTVLEHNMPSLRGRSHVYQQIWKDLFTRGLVNTDGLNVTMSGAGLSEKRTTPVGDMFLRFIADPSE